MDELKQLEEVKIASEEIFDANLSSIRTSSCFFSRFSSIRRTATRFTSWLTVKNRQTDWRIFSRKKQLAFCSRLFQRQFTQVS